MAAESAQNCIWRFRRRIALAVALVAGVLFCRMSTPVAAQENHAPLPDQTQAETQRMGKTVRVKLPISGWTLDQVRQSVRRAIEKAGDKNAQLMLIFEFFVPEAQDDYGRGSEFGAAFDLAGYDKLINMRRSNDLASQQDDGAWRFIVDFDCQVLLATGV